jgi:FSR family fosmidomycin resistance protein-like MFS transporter
LTHFEGGLLVTAVGLLSGLLQPVVGHVADTRAVRKVFMVFGMLLLGASVSLFALFHDFYLLLISAALISVGLSTYHPQALASLSEQYHESKGRMIGLHGISGALGYSVAPVFIAFVESAFGWESVYRYAFIPALVMALLLFRFLVPAETPPKPPTGLIGKVGPELALIGLSAFFLAFVFRGVTAFIPTYYYGQGESFEVSNLILFATLIPSVIGAPLGGYLSDRFGRLLVILITLLPISPLLFVFAQTPGLLSALLLFGMGFSRALNFPVYLAHASDISDLGGNGSSLGLVFGAVFTAGAISPSVVGYLIDVMGYASTFRVLAGLALLSLIPIVLLARRRTDGDSWR